MNHREGGLQAHDDSKASQTEPINSTNHPNMMYKVIRDRFPWLDKLALNLNCCRRSTPYSDYINGIPPQFEFKEEFKENFYDGLALKLKVKETGSMLLDPNVMHPFVRIHIIDMNTAKYLAKSDSSKPGVYNKESVQYVTRKGVEEPTSIYNESSPVDFLLPLSTTFFDMRIKGQNSCQWDQEFVINENAQNILQKNVVILFEILECNTKLILRQDKRLRADNMYPVAWAYLRPLGKAHIHMSRSRLQLYYSKFKFDEVIKKQRPFDHRTPEVFLDYNWERHEKYPSFLEIELGFV